MIDANLSTLPLFYLLCVDNMEAWKRLPILSHISTGFAGLTVETTELHRRWWAVQAERWANSQDVAGKVGKDCPWQTGAVARVWSR